MINILLLKNVFKKISDVKGADFLKSRSLIEDPEELQ